MFNRSNPYYAFLKERQGLNKKGSSKDIQHLVIDIKGSGINYRVGDSLGVLPCNSREVLEKTLKMMKASGDELIKSNRIKEELPLHVFLKRYANISDISKSLIQEVELRQTNIEKKRKLKDLLDPLNKEKLKQYIASHELWDFLEEHGEVSFTPQEICDKLRGLVPRLYSIASSMKAVGEEVHLTVAKLEYQTGNYLRKGVATNYLCNEVNIFDTKIPIYIQESRKFNLPKCGDNPLIMVGPGTGIAPFRAFMQERGMMQSSGKNWLFFGERNCAYDFLYKDFWMDLEKRGILRLDLAFSRDGEKKVYVQHKMWENANDIWKWLERGAYFYVCGDAQHMAKDVDCMLHSIVEREGEMSDKDARAYVKALKEKNRYQRDVY